ncbi:MAG: HEPN domain-containing protein [Coriobacteriia bacterium]|nr:HEPN domain-containing protein [Coriobacteriia bacterium]
MSKASDAFQSSIGDAKALLAYFDGLPKSSPADGEVLKRAGLIMALTAWETYVEDRILEEVTTRLKVIEGSYAGKFVHARLHEELRRLHNPTSDKVRRLYLEYLEYDVTATWEWANYKSADAKKTLDKLISTRGDVVHRSNPPASGGPPAAHPVKRDDLDKAIRFLGGLVEATERGLAS